MTPEMAMAPALLLWTAWLLVLRHRSRTRGSRAYRALAYVAALVGVNAVSVLSEALGLALTEASKWGAVVGTTLLGLDGIRKTWSPDSPDSRALAPPTEEEVAARVEAEVSRRMEEREKRIWNRARSAALADVVLMECDEAEAHAASG